MQGNHVATTTAQSEYRVRAAKLVVAVTATLGTALAYAAAEQTGPSDELTEIIVTATRQATTVQTTPISIEAFTGAQIASRGIVDIDSLVSSVPDIAVRNAGGPGEMEFEIRGLNSQGGNASMVGMYFGEIPLSTAMGAQVGKNMMNTGLYDMQRVEVLSGPQGTLYGSSSMGGTIRLIANSAQLNTYAASTEAVVSSTISGGGINHQENGMVNLPLGDTAAVRIVGSFTNDSGWVNRLVIADGAVSVDPGAFPDVTRPSNFYSAPLQEALTGVNTTQIDSVRAGIFWQPTDNLSIEPIAMYQSTQQGGPPTVDVNGNPTHPRTPAVWAHYEIYDSPEQQTDILGFGSLNVVYRFPSFSVTSATGFWHRNFLDLQDDTEQVASAVGIPVYDASGGGLGPQLSFKGPGNLEQDSSRQLSEEFRLTSTAPGPLQWVAGYFYQDLHSESDISALAPQASAIFGGPNESLNFVPEVLIQNAVYGHVSWRFSQNFEIAAGARYYRYSLNEPSTQIGAFTVLGGEGNNVPFKEDIATAASGTVPSFTLTYNVDSDHMVYVRIGKGFRLGGASGDVGPVAVTPASNTNPVFAAEVANECGLQAKILLTKTCNPNIFLPAPATYSSDWLWSYELGEKSSFFGHRLIANLDAYLEDWYNPQLATNLAGYGLGVNGGNARIKGIDAQLQGLLPGGFDVTLNASYIDAKFVDGSSITGFPAGSAIPDTPEVAASIVLSWKHDLAEGRALFGSLEGNYTGTRTDVPFGVAATLLNINQVLVHMPAYGIANLRFGVRGERNGGDRWTAALFVNNLTNNHVLLDPQPQISLQTQAFERYVINQPLTAGIDVSYGF
jgi:outer membrane receptor protein involved in Fe transport